jgi:hypothetical protein
MSGSVEVVELVLARQVEDRETHLDVVLDGHLRRAHGFGLARLHQQRRDRGAGDGVGVAAQHRVHAGRQLGAGVVGLRLGSCGRR